MVCDVKSLPVPMEELRGPVTDVMLAAYALNPQRPSFKAQALCEAEGVSGFEEHPATALRALAERQEERLRETGLERIYREIELPLAHVLRDMEREGFLVDAGALEALGVQFRARIAELTDEIAEMSGERINLNSPKQLGEMLFERMGLPTQRKNHRGYSTDKEVLESLAEDYPICAKILDYRKYQKLESHLHPFAARPARRKRPRPHAVRPGRYGDRPPELGGAEPAEHPRAHGAGTRDPPGVHRAAGLDAGRRRLFADRAAGARAHLRRRDDVRGVSGRGRTSTPARRRRSMAFALDEVTGAMRSASKAVNFGIVYGISDFALAKNISVTRAEAKAFIDRYFERYPGIRRYMDSAVAEGKEKGLRHHADGPPALPSGALQPPTTTCARSVSAAR